jgi:hypothetical protein
MSASDKPHFLFGYFKQVFALEKYLTTDYDSRRVGNKAKNGEGADALTACTLADETYALAFVYVVGKTVVGSDFSFFGIEICSKVFNFEYFLCDCPSPLSLINFLETPDNRSGQLIFVAVGFLSEFLFHFLKFGTTISSQTTSESRVDNISDCVTQHIYTPHYYCQGKTGPQAHPRCLQHILPSGSA